MTGHRGATGDSRTGWVDGDVPAHDPLSEEMDLITYREADARLYEELLVISSRLEAARAGADAAEVAALEKRRDALYRVVERLRADRA